MIAKALTLLTLVFSLTLTSPIHADQSRILQTIRGDDFVAELRQMTEPENVLVYDLVEAGPNSVSGFIARQFLLTMATQANNSTFESVVLSYKGAARYQINGEDIRKLAKNFRLGDMAAFHTLMRLPAIVRSLGGDKPFKSWTGSGISVLSARSADFNSMNEYWYLGELLKEIKG